MFRLVHAMLIVAVLTCSVAAAEPKDNPPQPPEAGKLTPAEQKFQQAYTGVTLDGFYTDSGNKDPNATGRNTYSILALTKATGDIWLVKSRVKFGGLDATLPPLPLVVKFAGETPVFTVDKVPFPGIGTYSARVVLHNGRFAGTWNGDNHGGHVWGEVKKLADEPQPKEPAKDDAPQKQ